MITVQVSTIINSPVSKVFAFVSNFENHPKWETDFQEVKRLSGEMGGVGTTYQCLLKFPGQTVASKFEITEYAENEKIAYEGAAAGPAKPRGSLLFESVAGGTKVTSLPRPEFLGLFKLLEPLMAGYIQKNNVAHLNNLKQLLEA
jgi:uncharacterized membrane protein